MFFKNISVGSKLIIGFGSIVLLAFLMGAMAYSKTATFGTYWSEYESVLLAKKDYAEQALPKVDRNLSRIDKFIDKGGDYPKRIAEDLDALDKLIVDYNSSPAITGEEKEVSARIFSYTKTYRNIANTLAGMRERGASKDAMQQAVQGPGEKEFGNAIKELIRITDGQIKKRSEEITASVRATKWSIVTALVAMLVIASTITLVMTRSINRPLKQAVRLAERVAAGDLTGQIEIDGEDETGQLARALKSMNDSLSRIVRDVRLSSDTITVAAKEIAAGNGDLSQRTEEQASSLEETASSMEELTSTVKQNAENSRQANQLAGQATDIAVKGGDVVGRVVVTMDMINESSKKIVDIIGVIEGIAFQTNILSLNAAVEAARAGEQGRGFAVVAGEVRNLAQRSAAAAKEIKALIDDSVGKVSEGAKLVGEAGHTMDEIVTSVKKVNDMIAEIAAASAEQTSGIEQVNQAIVQMDEVTQQNAALVEQASASAVSLEEQAESLSAMVTAFKLDQGSKPVSPAKPPVKSEHAPVSKPRTTGLRRHAMAVARPAVRENEHVPGNSNGSWREF